MTIKYRGFSLIELMVTVGIMGIALALTLPNISDTYVAGKVENGVTNLSKDILYARTMAISNRSPVVMCNLSGSSCTEDGWANGYTIFLDSDGNGDYDSTNESLLRINEDFDYGTLSISNGANELTFASNGEIQTPVTFTYCPNIEKTYVKGVVVNQMGRAKITSDYDGDSLDETDPSNDDSHLTCS